MRLRTQTHDITGHPGIKPGNTTMLLSLWVHLRAMIRLLHSVQQRVIMPQFANACGPVHNIALVKPPMNSQ